MSATADRYVRSLDGIRGLAIALVMLYHGWTYARHGEVTVGFVVDVVRQVGWAGVDVFFVLSGFLITGILLKTKDQPGYWRTFWVRRSLRIFPLYYAVLVLVLVGGSLFAGLAKGIDNVWVNFLYLTNIWIGLKGEDLVPLDIAWSLAIEEQFYLLFPLLVRFCRERTLMVVLLAVVITAPVVRYLTWSYGAQPVLGPYVLPHCRMDALAMGALLRLATEHTNASHLVILRRMAAPLCVAALLVLCLLTRKDIGFIVAGYTLNALASAALLYRVVFASSSSILRRVFENRALCYLGRISYGVYLLHLIARVAVVKVLVHVFPRSEVNGTWFCAAQLTGMTVLTLGLATISFRYFEQPILRLKDRWAAVHPD
jgi:peptidoglycan/LPS O-acetylase OafA/YrhL